MTIYSTAPRVAKKFELQAVAISLHSLNTQYILRLDHILAYLEMKRKILFKGGGIATSG